MTSSSQTLALHILLARNLFLVLPLFEVMTVLCLLLKILLWSHLYMDACDKGHGWQSEKSESGANSVRVHVYLATEASRRCPHIKVATGEDAATSMG